MRPIVLFNVLCIFFLMGAAHSHGSIDRRFDLTTSGITATKITHPGAGHDARDLAISNIVELENDFEFIVTDDSEDEDKLGSEVVATTYPTLDWIHINQGTRSYAAALKHPGNRFRLQAPICGHIPDLYILQGVFRI